MNSDLRLQMPDSEHEHEEGQERCIRASLFPRPSSFVLRAFEACPSRQARDFEAVTGLTNVATLTIHPRRRLNVKY